MSRKADRRIKIRRTIDGKRTDRVKSAERERMLRLRNQGKTVEEIALELRRSERTVSKQLQKARTEKEQTNGSSQSSQKEVNPLLTKVREEHMAEIRILIEQWLEVIPNDPPGVTELGQWSFNRWGLPTGVNSITGNYQFKLLREHLPYENFWNNYSEWEALFLEYIVACVKIEEEIRHQGEAWPNILRLGEDFEKPILSQIFSKQMHQELDELRFRTYGNRLLAYLRYREDGTESRDTNILEAEHPEVYIESYQALVDKMLSSEEVAWLVTTQDELGSKQNLIRETLQDILIRRDYIMTLCKLCPGQTR